MKRSKQLLVLFVTGCAALSTGLGRPALAQPPTAWVTRYNGPGNSDDRARRVAVDDAGNVYVTGTTATIKYDAGGNELWVARSGISAVRLAVDSQGNVYVTGSLDTDPGTSVNLDYATVKYDAQGNEVWVRRYNGPGNRDDNARGLAIDSSGNVYITGDSPGAGTDIDYATIKYDAEGNQIWLRRYNGPGNRVDRASEIALNAAGNVYVTGTSFVGSVTGSDYATIKYDAEGNEVWVAHYSGPNSALDTASSLAVDATGNVYVTGGTERLRGEIIRYDYATVKYDANGNQLWVARYGEPSFALANAIALDGSGNVYVTGGSGASFGISADFVTVKYDAQGDQLWAARYNGPGNNIDTARALAVDALGNVYVTGESAGGFPGTMSDGATIKYDAEGNQLWVSRYNGPESRDDYTGALALDSTGNVYVTGFSYGAPGTSIDYITIKYAAVPNLRLTVTDSRRTDGGIELTLRLDNRGDAAAAQVQLTGATLAQQQAISASQSLGNIPAGGSATATLTFAGNVTPGTQTALRAQGSYSGGTFSANQRVVIP